MRGLLIRVGIDSTAGGWNSPVVSKTGEYVYVPIPESIHRKCHPGLARQYDELLPALVQIGAEFPEALLQRSMHLDPDFRTATYGDQGRRGAQIRKLQAGDFIVFYAGFRQIDEPGSQLLYALLGIFFIERLINAIDIPPRHWTDNAHTRRILATDADDIVVYGKKQRSGRLKRLIAIGEYRDHAYRVKQTLLDQWGGLSVRNGYIHRSGTLPEFLQSDKFIGWFQKNSNDLVQDNWEGRSCVTISTN